MTVLRVKQVWKKPKPEKPSPAVDRIEALTPGERANVLKALRVMQVRYRTLNAAADAMGIFRGTVARVSRGAKGPTAGFALRLARCAGVTVDDVLSGAFPKPGSCPVCGRSE